MVGGTHAQAPRCRARPGPLSTLPTGRVDILPRPPSPAGKVFGIPAFFSAASAADGTGSMTGRRVTDAPVLVTGASGFIAGHIIQGLLARGYRVRGTVRKPDASEMRHLRVL